MLQLLACPTCGSDLSEISAQELRCGLDHRFSVVDGIPVLLAPSMGDSGSGAASHTFAQLAGRVPLPDLAMNPRCADDIDPLVQESIAAAGGNVYRGLVGRLRSYPIPKFPESSSDGGTLLDIGCHWGRWTIAAERAGFRAIGLDPSLNAVVAARRVAIGLGCKPRFVVGDARYLPFRSAVFDYIFSFSVLQHFGRQDVEQTLQQCAERLRPRGTARIQMPNRWSALGVWHQARRRFRAPHGFEVRYWSWTEVKALMDRYFADVRVQADSFFSINAQEIALEHSRGLAWLAVFLGMKIHSASLEFTPLQKIADSLWAVGSVEGSH